MSVHQLHTAGVAVAPMSVLAVTIHDRPMSIAVYAQLAHRELWRRDASNRPVVNEPLGTAWGIVTHHPDETCATASSHWHVLGSRDDTQTVVVDVIPRWATNERIAAMLDALPHLFVGVPS